MHLGTFEKHAVTQAANAGPVSRRALIHLVSKENRIAISTSCSLNREHGGSPFRLAGLMPTRKQAGVDPPLDFGRITALQVSLLSSVRLCGTDEIGLIS